MTTERFLMVQIQTIDMLGTARESASHSRTEKDDDGFVADVVRLSEKFHPGCDVIRVAWCDVDSGVRGDRILIEEDVRRIAIKRMLDALTATA